MKLTSVKSSKDGKRIVCEDAIFDPSLATISKVEKDEDLVILDYDALGYGYPLDSLPILPSDAQFYVALTPTGIHISLFIGDYDDNPEAAQLLGEYGDHNGDIEFNVRMTENEKLLLMHRIATLMINQ